MRKNKTILKLKIGSTHTMIRYNKKMFDTREEAVQAIINHLQRMLDEVDFNNV